MPVLKQLLNECSIDIILHSDGPLLIKSGTIDAGGLDMNFVKTSRNGQNEIFIPGSSLKGLIRSYCEKIVRTLSDDFARCCDPFNNGKDKDKHNDSISCSQKFEWRSKGTRILPNGKTKENNDYKDKLSPDKIYADSCPVCKLFGSTSQASRFLIEDGYLMDSQKQNSHRQQRDGVGIDRYTGGTSEGAKFELEVFSFLDFKSRIYIRNFELWQLGLLAYTLYDFHEGLAKLGYGKSRGMGSFKIDISEVKISYLSLKISENNTPHHPELYGLNSLSTESGYDFTPDEKEAILIKDRELSRNSDEIGLRKSYIFKTWDDIFSLFKTTAPLFNKFLSNWDWNNQMKFNCFLDTTEV